MNRRRREHHALEHLFGGNHQAQKTAELDERNQSSEASTQESAQRVDSNPPTR